jgi:flagellar protein FliS
MFARTPASRQYASVGIESRVLGADPHALIGLLYDGAIEALSRARSHFNAKQSTEAIRYVGKARTIVFEGLRASLNRDQGGQLALQLDALYDYMTVRLIEAGRGNIAALDEVQRLLTELGDAWRSIEPSSTSTPPVAVRDSGVPASTKVFAQV